MEPVTLHELALAAGGITTIPSGRDVIVRRVRHDSRTVRPGDVFWAVRGPNHDGNAFVRDALIRGAVAAVVERSLSGVERPLVEVKDSTAALGQFARWYRSLLDTLVMGVTGSVGKTTTRELIFAALGGEPSVCRSEKNFNNQWGVPLTLLGLKKSHRYAVVEMGADHVGEIEQLAAIARPDIGVITRFGVAHIETFGSEEAIVRAKSELALAIPRGGFVVLPGDQAASHALAKRCRGTGVLVGFQRGNEHRVAMTRCEAGRLEFRLDGADFEIAANGQHMALSAAMAVVVARRLGRPDRDIAAGLREFHPVAGRGRVAVTQPWTVIDDTYNANPDSMRAAVEGLAAWPTRGRRVLVCGDMYGLGERATNAHLELGKQAASHQVDVVVAIGNFARQVAHGACRAGMDAHRLAMFPHRDEAVEWLRSNLEAGDVVWVKASRFMELERLVEALVHESESAWQPSRRAA